MPFFAGVNNSLPRIDCFNTGTEEFNFWQGTIPSLGMRCFFFSCSGSGWLTTLARFGGSGKFYVSGGSDGILRSIRRSGYPFGTIGK